MRYKYRNLVFSGGGVLGIAYLGSLEYLYKTNIIHSLTNLAGTSAGAITACLTSFNLPFPDLKALLDSLDYRKIPCKEDSKDALRALPQLIKEQLSNLFGNADCAYRLIKNYGWYSSQYLYSWIRLQIQSQFDISLKLPPYTFADFRNPSIHKHHRPFKNLYIIGTDISKSTSAIFSYETTPNMEVAEAVRISMSVPLLFEAVSSSCDINAFMPKDLYIDGGMLYNYPINLFDRKYKFYETLGIYFKSTPVPNPINNLVDFISSALSCSSSIQNSLYESNPRNTSRSICIHTGDISPFDFNICNGDATYHFLYEQGYRSAEFFFSIHKIKYMKYFI